MNPPAIHLPLNAHTLPFKEHDVVNLTLTGTIISVNKSKSMRAGEDIFVVEVNHGEETFIFDLPTSALSPAPPPASTECPQ